MINGKYRNFIIHKIDESLLKNITSILIQQKYSFIFIIITFYILFHNLNFPVSVIPTFSLYSFYIINVHSHDILTNHQFSSYILKSSSCNFKILN